MSSSFIEHPCQKISTSKITAEIRGQYIFTDKYLQFHWILLYPLTSFIFLSDFSGTELLVNSYFPQSCYSTIFHCYCLKSAVSLVIQQACACNMSVFSLATFQIYVLILMFFCFTAMYLGMDFSLPCLGVHWDLSEDQCLSVVWKMVILYLSEYCPSLFLYISSFQSLDQMCFASSL